MRGCRWGLLKITGTEVSVALIMSIAGDISNIRVLENQKLRDGGRTTPIHSFTSSTFLKLHYYSKK